MANVRKRYQNVGFQEVRVNEIKKVIENLISGNVRKSCQSFVFRIGAYNLLKFWFTGNVPKIRRNSSF